jgi:hypothetical protein
MADSVSMYLREIARIPLLSAHQEMWLSVQQKAVSRVAALQAQLDEQEAQPKTAHRLMGAMASALCRAWCEVSRGCDRLGVPPCDLVALVDEAKAIRCLPLPETVSYLYDALEQLSLTESQQGESSASLAGDLLDVFLLLYLLPESLLDLFSQAWRERRQLPSQG